MVDDIFVVKVVKVLGSKESAKLVSRIYAESIIFCSSLIRFSQLYERIKRLDVLD